MKLLIKTFVLSIFLISSANAQDCPDFIEEGESYVLSINFKDDYGVKVIEYDNDSCWAKVTHRSGFTGVEYTDWVNLNAVVKIAPPIKPR